MLERACDQNNSIMVECLLLLGADANQTKGATSLIYQVNIPGLTLVYLCYLTLPFYNSSSSSSTLFFHKTKQANKKRQPHKTDLLKCNSHIIPFMGLKYIIQLWKAETGGSLIRLKSARTAWCHRENSPLKGSYSSMYSCLCRVVLVLPESTLELFHHPTLKFH